MNEFLIGVITFITGCSVATVLAGFIFAFISMFGRVFNNKKKGSKSYEKQTVLKTKDIPKIDTSQLFGFLKCDNCEKEFLVISDQDLLCINSHKCEPLPENIKETR